MFPEFDADGEPGPESRRLRVRRRPRPPRRWRRCRSPRASRARKASCCAACTTTPTVYTLTVTGGDGAATRRRGGHRLPARGARVPRPAAAWTTSTTGVEYPGAPPLSATPVVGADCPTPASVDTVTAPRRATRRGVHPGHLGPRDTLAPGQAVTIELRGGRPAAGQHARLPGREAELPSRWDRGRTWTTTSVPPPGRTARRPRRPTSSTSPGPTPARWPPAAAPTVDVTAQHTVSVNDVRILKSVSPTECSWPARSPPTRCGSTRASTSTPATSSSPTSSPTGCARSGPRNYVGRFAGGM